MDSHQAHMMLSIVSHNQGLGIQVQHIPSGCTYLWQLVDVGMNHLIMMRMLVAWKEQMCDGGMRSRRGGKDDILGAGGSWIIRVYITIKEDTGKNARIIWFWWINE